MAIIETTTSNTYRTPEALDAYSLYSLFPQERLERHLFEKYYRPGESVLDLACGLGRTTLRLHEMGCRVKGVDLSDVFINCAQKRFPYLDLSIGNFTKLAFANNSFDHVLISYNGIDCAHPEPERIKVIRECFRVVKPGGTFVFSSHNIKSLYLSPVYFRSIKGMLWKTRNTLAAFKVKDYIFDVWAKAHLFYACPKYIVTQTEKEGFLFREAVGLRMTRSVINRFLSPYIYYAFIRE